MKNNKQRVMGALKRATGIGTFERSIGGKSTETRFGTERLSIPTGTVTYRKEDDAKLKLKPSVFKKGEMLMPKLRQQPMRQYGDKGYKPSTGIGVSN